jgi:hypothetical protein
MPQRMIRRQRSVETGPELPRRRNPLCLWIGKTTAFPGQSVIQVPFALSKEDSNRLRPYGTPRSPIKVQE